MPMLGFIPWWIPSNWGVLREYGILRTDIKLFLREILLSTLISFLHLTRANIASLKADVFCFGRFELKTDFLGYLKRRVIAV